MNIVIPIKLVPDLVEELEINDSETALDMAWMRFILNEFDEHAIEQGILLKERIGGTVTVIAPDIEDADDVLFTAAAKGADRLIKLSGRFDETTNNHALARAFGEVINDMEPDLVMTGVQAHNDLDGQVGPLLAEIIGFPYVGYVAGVKIDNGSVSVRKEYPGGLLAEMEVTLPAVLGIQAADQPPRYVAFSKVRQSMKTAVVDSIPFSDMDPNGGVPVLRMFHPEISDKAIMLVGDGDEIAEALMKIFDEIGILN